MRVVVTGGTGFIGRALVPALIGEHHDVVVLTRGRKDAVPGGANGVLWDGHSGGEWESQIDGAEAVINLAGESLDARRWTRAQKKRIVESRVNGTRALVNAMRNARKKPRVLINGSAIGFYGDVPDGSVTEEWRRGNGFLAETVETWEREAHLASPLGVRVVTLRSGVVLGSNGGVFARMLLPFRLFIGGTLGSGRQWFSWVHRDDAVGVMMFAMKRDDLSGPVNVTAPEAVTMKQFCSALGRVLDRPSWAPVPAFMLKLLLGEMSGMILTGQRVIPAQLLEKGYVFRFPQLQPALENIARSMKE